MNPYTLVIVDMQESFLDSDQRRVKMHCKRLIKKAVQDRAPIIFLEYKGYGPTMDPLIKALGNYKNAYFLEKDDPDGSSEVQKALLKWKLPSNRLCIAGVNTDQCVFETATVLTGRLPKARIEVHADACDSCFGAETHNEYIFLMQRSFGIDIV